MATACAHIDLVQTVIQPKQHVCEACVKIGAHWLHLRTCQTCGATLCCDSSPNRHASKHAKTSTHPVIVLLPGRSVRGILTGVRSTRPCSA